MQTEKLASLGQLTAGIAHEIKNPLNFVNNFAALSVELIDELKDRRTWDPPPRPRRQRAELDEVRELLTSNLEKIVQHGKRADGIVKKMLVHSREVSGEQRRGRSERADRRGAQPRLPRRPRRETGFQYHAGT